MIFIVSQSNAIVIKFLGTPHFLYKIVIKRLEMTVEHSVTGFIKKNKNCLNGLNGLNNIF